MLAECQMTRKLVTKSRPRSPAFPLVSSIESSLSISISPGRIFICLEQKYKCAIHVHPNQVFDDMRGHLRHQDVKPNFSMFPDTINRGTFVAAVHDSFLLNFVAKSRVFGVLGSDIREGTHTIRL